MKKTESILMCISEALLPYICNKIDNRISITLNFYFDICEDVEGNIDKLLSFY